jgi:glycosyltransferase involved in cell wall biosynthesis
MESPQDPHGPLPGIVILTGVYDDQYLDSRSEKPHLCTSAGKRVVLYGAIEQARGSPILLLSPQPRGYGKVELLPEWEGRFASFRQIFSKSSGVRKIRILLDMVHYARLVAKHTRPGQPLIIDNYELIYVVAIYYCLLLGRRNPIYLDYEDGKHLIDKGIWRIMSGLAESLGRPLVRGALLATPNLASRLPAGIPKVVVPGILRDGIVPTALPKAGEPVRFLYSGSLDKERGVPLLLDYLELGDFPPDVVFHITGQGHFLNRLAALQERFPTLVHFHGSVSQEKLGEIRSICHFGLNLQSSTNPISDVTYPSKTFDYLNAGIRVISTRAAGVEEVLGAAAIYLDEETPAQLSRAVQEARDSLVSAREVSDGKLLNNYSFGGTAKRIREMLNLGHVTPPSA